MITCLDTGEVCETYQEYLKTVHWKRLREKVHKIKVNKFCFICSTPDNLHVHHKTYDNLGNESTRELMLLCGDCHKKVHERLNNPTYKNEKLYNAARIIRREYLNIRR